MGQLQPRKPLMIRHSGTIMRWLLCRFADKFVDTLFGMMHRSNPLYEELELSDPKNLAKYKEITKANWRSFIASHVDVVMSAQSNLILKMRQAYFEGRNLILEFGTFSENPFAPMSFEIPWDRMDAFFRGHIEAFATLIHSFRSQRKLKLSLEDAITEDKTEKLSNSMGKLWKTFKLLKAKDEYRKGKEYWLPEAKKLPADGGKDYFGGKRTITVRFYKLTGSGVLLGSGRSSTIHRKQDETGLNRYGFESHILEFAPTEKDKNDDVNKKSVRNMIVGLSMASFYLFLDQDHVAYINVGESPHNIFSLTARQSLPLEVIQSDAVTKVPVSVFGNSKYYQFADQLTPEALEEFGEKWSGIFGPGDLGNFLEYDDVDRDQIVRFIWDLVKEKLLEEVNAILLEEKLIEKKMTMDQFKQIIRDCGFDLTGGKLVRE